jgi:hypothetical protein
MAQVRALLAGLALLTAAPLASAQDTSGLHASLMLLSPQTRFHSGEPIRVPLTISSDTPGFLVGIDAPDAPDDQLVVTPEAGVFRWSSAIADWRDSFGFTSLTTPFTVDYAINQWVRFERSGDYSVRLKVARLRRSLDDTSIPQTTNEVSFHVEVLSEQDEAPLVKVAAAQVEASITAAQQEQVAAAKELAFLSGDAAALEKLRLYQDPRIEKVPALRKWLRHGLFVSRHPALLVDAFERELRDADRPLAWTLIVDAENIRDWSKDPGHFRPPPVPNTGLDPYLVEAIESLPRRGGTSRVITADTILNTLVARTPPHIIHIVVEDFDQLPVGEREWLVEGRWEQIRDIRLAPTLARMIDEVDKEWRETTLERLIDIAPDLAIAPALSLISDPTAHVQASMLVGLPKDALKPAVPDLIRAIRVLAQAPPGTRTYPIKMKSEILLLIGDTSVVTELKDLYGRFGSAWPPEIRDALAKCIEGLSKKSVALLLIRRQG